MARGGRIALQTALGALAGGVEGYAKQQDYNRQLEERSNERKRQALNDALAMAERNIVEEPTGVTLPEIDSALARRVTVGDRTFRMPTEEGRARQQATVTRQLAEEEKQRVRREAFDTLRSVDPSMRTATYNPSVMYESLLEDRQATNRAGAAARATASAYAQRDEAERNARLAQDKATALAWYNATTRDLPEAGRRAAGDMFGQMQAQLQQAGLPSGVADVAYALYQGARGGTALDAQEALAAQREADARRTSGRGGGRTVGAPPGAGGRAVTPPPGAAANLAPRGGETRETYYVRLVGNGMPPAQAYEMAIQNIPDTND